MRRLSTLLLPFSMKNFIVPLLFMLQLGLEILSTDAATTVSGNETDQVALLEFKAKIFHDPQNVMSSWNNSVHFCNWEGITCGRRHRRVITLDLRSKSLVGSLSPHIGNMSFLREIRLQLNNLQGEIPPEISRLFRLEYLYLANNSFTGEIPSNLSNCAKLIELHLGFNKLQGKFPIQLATLPKLSVLSIRRNYFTGRIPQSIGNMSSLEFFSVTENSFSGSIPYALGQLNHLSTIGLGDNNFSGIIPSVIYNISSIRVFSMGSNSLHGSLPSNIGILLPNLQFFQVNNNYLSGSIPVSLSNASNLQVISLASNNFTGKVPVQFGDLQQILGLTLGGNNLGGQGDDDFKFIISLANCSNLEYLELSYNQLTGELPDSVANLSATLRHLAFSNNQIYGSLPHGLFALVNLPKIILDYNQITGIIPMEIGKVQKLQELYLGMNRLSGQIPSTIGNLSSLIRLELQLNNLQGNIPSSIGNCYNLLFLLLSGNNLTGIIPKQLFSTPSKLVGIDLSQNYLVGSVPSEIGNLFNLGQFYISQNLLSGEIPNDLGRCKSLEFLFMQNNNFQGTIPTSLESLRGLRQIDLSKNNFSGKIPEYLGTFALEYLNLSFNNFEGEVPVKGVLANSSAISLEGNKQLCGGIPELRLPRCIIEMNRRKSHHVAIVVITTSCVFGFIMVSAFLYCWLKKRKGKQSLASLLMKLKKSPGSFQVKSFPRLSYERILKATNGFSTLNLIGVGTFGSVYKGTLEEDGVIIAVKVLNLQQQGAAKSFMAECKVLQNIRHKNLLRIITSCSSIDFQGNDFKALIYEYMPNGNLEKWLHPSSEIYAEPIEQQNLNLLQRMNIAIDVANALTYLHHSCQKPIIHCDLKPSNILLDNDMVAHIGDFGLAKFLSHFPNPVQSSSIGVRGTIGYTAPEYGLGSEQSISGDVYSYGILLLEMVTGKKPTDDIFMEGLNLHNFARMTLLDNVLEIVDPILLQEDEGPAQATNEYKIECLIAIIKVGVTCSMESPQDRMDISNAVNELQSIRNKYIGARTGHPGQHTRQ